jgi:hypothetical protein
MMTAEKQVADAIAELKTLGDNYRAASQAWLRERRQIIDICIQHGDLRTAEVILDHLEKSCDWTRWPADR